MDEDNNGVAPTVWEILESEDDEDYVPADETLDYDEDEGDLVYELAINGLDEDALDVLSDGSEMDYYSDVDDRDIYTAHFGSGADIYAKSLLLKTALRQRDRVRQSILRGGFGAVPIDNMSEKMSEGAKRYQRKYCREGDDADDDDDDESNKEEDRGVDKLPLKTPEWLHNDMKQRYGYESQPLVRDILALQSQCIPSNPCSGAKFYENAIYGGKFNSEGTQFFNISQGFKLQLYNTRNVHRPRFQNVYNFLGYHTWTLTDSVMAVNGSWMAFSSLTPQVTILTSSANNTEDAGAGEYEDEEDDDDEKGYFRSSSSSSENEESSVQGSTITVTPPSSASFGRLREPVYSLCCEDDNNTLYAGTGANSLRAADIESGSVKTIGGHNGDVNGLAVLSRNVIVSGSDDCSVKIWDTRLSPTDACVGGFLGHTEGITAIDVREDGRHIISNGKDQALKLWDVRNGIRSEKDIRDFDPRKVSSQFDYRFYRYRSPRVRKHPLDSSLMTYFGHTVEKSLVRCHFSPSHSTGQQYISSGSADGCVYIWNLDGTLVRKLRPSDKLSKMYEIQNDHEERALGTFSRNRYSEAYLRHPLNVSMIKEAAWHPYEPVIYASGWVTPTRTRISAELNDPSTGALIIMPYSPEQLTISDNQVDQNFEQNNLIDPRNDYAPNGEIWLSLPYINSDEE